MRIIKWNWLVSILLHGAVTNVTLKFSKQYAWRPNFKYLYNVHCHVQVKRDDTDLKLSRRIKCILALLCFIKSDPPTTLSKCPTSTFSYPIRVSIWSNVWHWRIRTIPVSCWANGELDGSSFNMNKRNVICVCHENINITST